MNKYEKNTNETCGIKLYAVFQPEGVRVVATPTQQENAPVAASGNEALDMGMIGLKRELSSRRKQIIIGEDCN